ncbi:unnamed protein product [Chilo suppressalis]|uniref:DNA-directed DNA polymerase family A palm domain-containing protein n=1 Tax=Chilo suppressalis TaxID=168631 RepID=A0ABN8L486_CHISP|nr:unnamed protein product [Chilo suppressalis]
MRNVIGRTFSDKNEDSTVYCRDDLINFAVEPTVAKNKKNETSKIVTFHEEKNQIITELPKITLSPEPSRIVENVNWENMVDFELFHDAVIAQPEETIVPMNKDLKCKSLIPELPLINEKLKKPVAKRKKIISIEKNNKKPDSASKLIRKNKCTKAVKNWLDDVDQNVPDESIEANNQHDTSENHNNKSIEITKKKEVQTKLTNKDGIMKYGKPESISVNEKLAQAEVDKDIPQAGDIAQDKRTKPKFLVPIKSQIPIKDISYEILTNENKECIAEMDKLKDNTEILAVLVYRNGFCQLNSIYTEETCRPDGILFHVDKRFYFINKFDGDVKQIAGSLLDPENLPESFSEVQKYLSYTPEYTITTDSALQKAAWYSTLLKECFSKLKFLLMENSLWKIFEEVEMRLLPIVADMERFGVCVDMEKLKSMEQVLLTKMQAVEQECHKAAGKAFQINSPVQVRALLYHDLKLDELSNIRVKWKFESGCTQLHFFNLLLFTQLRSLMSLHPLPKLILEYRHLHKAHATFLAGIANQVKDGVVRPTWVQIASATGRMASNNPNLQAIPKTPFNLEMFPESEDAGGALLNFRSVYVSREGFSLLAADFRHVECRVFAAAAGDRALLDALTHDDLFRALAANWYLPTLSKEALFSRRHIDGGALQARE